jgi:DNA polymerase elongation subunit (family B)
MTYLYLDIETIPAQSERAQQRVAANVKPPAAMKKADTIAAWEKEQKPAAVEEAIAKTSFRGDLGHICCVGYAFDDDEPQTVSWPLQHKSEAECLHYLAKFISVGRRASAPTIIGHNVAAFDIRFIWQRAMILGVAMPSWFPRDPKPWGIEVFDTMTAFAGARGTISMDDLAAALNLPGKGDVDGSMVAQMWADGKHQEIADYCKDDVVRTRSIHRMMIRAFGEAA